MNRFWEVPFQAYLIEGVQSWAVQCLPVFVSLVIVQVVVVVHLYHSVGQPAVALPVPLLVP
jgi:hypothetical protein